MNINTKINTASVVIIFKRVGNIEGNYSLIPYDVLCGNEIIQINPDETTSKYFVDVNEMRYPFMEDNENFEEDGLVYGFPYNIEKFKNNVLELNKLISSWINTVEEVGYTQWLNEEDEIETLVHSKELETIINPSDDFQQALCDATDVLETVKNGIITEMTPESQITYPFDMNDPEMLYKPKSIEKKLKTLRNINVKEIYDYLTSAIIAQDSQIKKILSAIVKNLNITNHRLKSNILVCGPTGTGKTEILRLIAKKLDIPIVIEDITQYTVAGYVGEDPTDLLKNLIINANYNVEKAQHGIIVVDEIDKLCSDDKSEKVKTTGVLESLLKMMEDGTYHININRNEYSIKTGGITFVFLGAFSDLLNQASKKNVIGFGGKQYTTSTANDEIFSDENMEKYGLIPEFQGRCSLKIILNNLSIDNLIQILKTSINSPLTLNKELLDNYGVRLLYDEKLIEAIAKKAINIKKGARSLNTIVDEMLSEALFDIQVDDEYTELHITPETVIDNKNYTLSKKRKLHQ